MGFFKEFKEFAMKGNVMDMAIGVIIGGAFGKIVTSLVNDILMPLVGALIGNVNFTTLSLTLRAPKLNEAGEIVSEAVADSWKRLLEPSIETEIRNFYKEKADETAIRVFAENLKQLLL